MVLRRRLVLGALIAATWLFTVFRAIPLRNGDRGVFVSMAERIAAGDTLYVDVWDNKEPLFFLTLALGRTISPTMDVVIELAWIALCALAIYTIIRAYGAPSVNAVVGGFIATPLIITGGAFYAGFSHLPATAIFLGTTALAVRHSFVLAGALIPVLALYKIIMVPMSLGILILVLLSVRRAAAWKRAIIGAAGASVLFVALLLLRGEFIGYLELVWSNIGYSQQPLGDAYDVPLWNHIEPVLTASTVITVAATLLVIVTSSLLKSSDIAQLRILTLWALASAFVITAITGLWEHHGQIFSGPAALAVSLAMVMLGQVTAPWLSILGIGVLSGIVLSGGLSVRTMIDTGLSGPTRFQDLHRYSTAALDLQQFPAGTSYMRLGSNTDDSHAYGLSDYSFACYQFVQYYYDIPSTLEYIPRCLPNADVVIVDKSLMQRDGRATWNEFVERSEAVLASQFTCVPRDYGRLCTKLE